MERILKKTNGITLIALIITVVVMLILAGVAISSIVSGDGLFSRTRAAVQEYQKQSLVELVRSAEMYLELDMAFDKNIKMTASQLKAKIEEVGDLDGSKYHVSADDDTVTIIDKKNKLVLDVLVTENGSVEIESSTVEDITNIVKPTFEVTLEPATGYSETVTIRLTIKEETNGIVKVQLPDLAGTVNEYNKEKEISIEYPVTENGTYKFIAESANGRRATESVVVNNTMSVAEIETEVLNPDGVVEASEIKVSYDPSPRIGGNILTNGNRYQYIVGEESETNKWKSVQTTVVDGKAVATLEIEENGEFKTRYFDGTEGHKTATLNITNVDKLAPTTAALQITKEGSTTVTLTATGADAPETEETKSSGIAKYELYQMNASGGYDKILTEETTEGTVTLEATELEKETEYKFKVIVYDAVGRGTESNVVTAETVAGMTAVQAGIEIGDYVNYNAGTWTEDDLTAITQTLTLDSGSTVTPSVHATVRTATSAANTTLPNTQGQFGGFVLEQSRDTNSKEYNSSYKPDAEGWRVWDISGNTITLISAGHPETYYHASGNSVNSIGILKKRDWTMYENEFAETNSAHVLTGQEAADWYNDRFGTSYAITENGGSNSTFYAKTFTTTEPISVLENNSYFWLASAYSTSHLYYVNPDNRNVYSSGNNAFGVRVLVSLKSDVCFEEGTGDGGVGSPWKIVGQE